MIDEKTFKIVISIGEIVDKFLINIIKIEKIGNSKTKELVSNNMVLKKVIDDFVLNCDKDKLDLYINSLTDILEKQWDYLDVSLDDGEGIQKRMKYALMAQELNIDRVYWKNKINNICGYSQEIKRYGKV